MKRTLQEILTFYINNIRLNESKNIKRQNKLYIAAGGIYD